MPQCEATYDPRLPYPTAHVQCSRKATVERDGRHYCWQHDPEYQAKQAAKSYRETRIRVSRNTLTRLHIAAGQAVLEGEPVPPEVEAEYRQVKAELESLGVKS